MEHLLSPATRKRKFRREKIVKKRNIQTKQLYQQFSALAMMM